jgi:hypothetical protein
MMDRPEAVIHAVSDFWQLFRQRAAELAVARSADVPVYDVLLDQLQKVDRGLYFEFSADPGACELIITAEGNRSLFPLVRAIVAAAPTVHGWTMHALKPKLGFPETTGWENLHLRTADIVFDPLECEGSDDLGLRIFIRGIDEKDIEDAHNAVLRTLDHGLGEEKFAETVHYTEVRPLPADAATDDFIPLVELEEFILWREGKRRC